VNADGQDDLIIGAPLAGNQDLGQSYLIYGQRGTQCRWTSPASGDWDDLSNWSCPGGPSSGDEVFIQPVNGLTVSGSSSTKTIKSLDIGTQYAGTATLAIAPLVNLVIAQTLTLEADGKLSGDGMVTARGGIINQGEIDLGNQGLQLAGGTLTNTGLIQGGGTINNLLVNTADGEVHVASGEQMHLTYLPSQFNAGLMDILGDASQAAEIEFDGLLGNEGDIIAGNAILRFNQGLTNHNDGTMDITSGTSVIYGDVTNHGTVTAMTGSTVVYVGNVTGSGSFPGVSTHVFEKDLAPQPVPSKLNFWGDVVFGPGARLESDVAGTAVDWHDRLDIAGSVTLDGTLDLVPLTPYTDPTTTARPLSL